MEQLNQTADLWIPWATRTGLITAVFAAILLMIEGMLRSRLSARFRYACIQLVFIQLILVPGLLIIPMSGGRSGTHPTQIESSSPSGVFMEEAYPNPSGTRSLDNSQLAEFSQMQLTWQVENRENVSL